MQHALRCTIDAVAKIKPEVGVQGQNGGFSYLDSAFFEICFFFHSAFQHALRSIDAVAKTKPEVGVSTKMEVLLPWTHFLEFFYFFLHSALQHHALRCTIDAVAKIKPEVGVQRQNSVKMEVFLLWTLHFF